jgi:hypothetical protein
METEEGEEAEEFDMDDDFMGLFMAVDQEDEAEDEELEAPPGSGEDGEHTKSRVHEAAT